MQNQGVNLLWMAASTAGSTKLITSSDGLDGKPKTFGSGPVRPEEWPGTSISPMIVTPRALANLSYRNLSEDIQAIPALD